MHNDLAIYVHYPYCIRKCPYCDFNSHAIAARDSDFDLLYLQALKEEFALFIPYIDKRKLISLFIGGGTPSLASAAFIDGLITFLAPYMSPECEITMEANPGTVEIEHLASFYHSGVNRLSLGIQSFNDAMLKRLGRIHTGSESRAAIEIAHKIGFNNLNLDLMHGLMQQDVPLAMADLKEAIGYGSTHLSWYELTIEENTYFAKNIPLLPSSDDLFAIEQEGFKLLQASGFERYEISAFAKKGYQCVHNSNYWRFGDYIGLGAGAHSKLSFVGQTLRKANTEDPKAYLQQSSQEGFYKVKRSDLAFEYMLNRLRLFGKISYSDYKERTGEEIESIMPSLQQAAKQDLLKLESDGYSLTDKGKLMLNEILSYFLD